MIRPIVTGIPRMVLPAKTAGELMTQNPGSVRASSTVQEAIRFLTDKNFSAAPVIDEAGRPVGVLSRADILVHERRAAGDLPYRPDYFDGIDVELVEDDFPYPGRSDWAEAVQVRDIMTPVVFSVSPDTPLSRVAEDMVALHVHRLFVVGDDGVLVGVISALDLVRFLEPEVV